MCKQLLKNEDRTNQFPLVMKWRHYQNSLLLTRWSCCFLLYKSRRTFVIRLTYSPIFLRHIPVVDVSTDVSIGRTDTLASYIFETLEITPFDQRTIQLFPLILENVVLYGLPCWHERWRLLQSTSESKQQSAEPSGWVLCQPTCPGFAPFRCG